MQEKSRFPGHQRIFWQSPAGSPKRAQSRAESKIPRDPSKTLNARSGEKKGAAVPTTTHFDSTQAKKEKKHLNCTVSTAAKAGLSFKNQLKKRHALTFSFNQASPKEEKERPLHQVKTQARRSRLLRLFLKKASPFIAGISRAEGASGQFFGGTQGKKRSEIWFFE